MKKIYLCGGIEDIPIEQAASWRSKAKKVLGEHRCLDPMRIKQTMSYRIVLENKKDINESSVLLVNATIPSWGTGMEILYAHERDKMVVAYIGKNVDDYKNPWMLQHCTKITNTIEEAMVYIIGELNEKETNNNNVRASSSRRIQRTKETK